MTDPIRHRVALWLRGERALGMKFVQLRQRVLELSPVSASPARVAEVLGRQADVAREVVRPAPPASALPAASRPSRPIAAPQAALAAVTSDSRPTAEKRAELLVLDESEVRGCVRCRLSETRTHTVFGEGDPDAKIFFVGEGPGETEDLSGRPFVGRAGQLLDKQIAAMGLRREQVFIANIVKCRPPDNRQPAPDEVATCTPYLQRQLEIIRPQVIVTLGLPAAKYMLQTTTSMGRLRGQWQSWRGIKVMPTYHPAYLLRSPTYENRSAVWSDLQKVMAEVGISPGKDVAC